ncbi:hypothetical protein ACODT3_42765 [Streptomyces sp. 4.24]|uniref:hypothetical protein n=1 Tax=Streptomyces tritrimontium TaxID=3406573 RepID=UPI003BB6F920
MKIKDNPAFKSTHVCLEGIDAVFPAYVADRTWRNHACPAFDLETIHRIADATQVPLKGPNPDTANAIHILDGGRNADGTPKVIVARIDWQYVDSEGLEESTDVIPPTEDGLYDLGSLEWAWHEIAPQPAR